KSGGDGNVYRTHDQGGTWADHKLKVSSGEKHVTRISRLVEDRSDNTGNTVFATTSNGIYRTTDFGKNWKRVFKKEKGAEEGVVREVSDIVQDVELDQVWYA